MDLLSRNLQQRIVDYRARRRSVYANPDQVHRVIRSPYNPEWDETYDDLEYLATEKMLIIRDIISELNDKSQGDNKFRLYFQGYHSGYAHIHIMLWTFDEDIPYIAVEDEDNVMIPENGFIDLGDYRSVDDTQWSPEFKTLLQELEFTR